MGAGSADLTRSPGPQEDPTTAHGVHGGAAPVNAPGGRGGVDAVSQSRTYLEAALMLGNEEKNKILNDLYSRCRVKETTFIIKTECLIPPVRETNVVLPPYQVRYIQSYFLAELKTRMTSKNTALTLPFVLLVDPRTCPTKEDFIPENQDQYLYWVLGGNHSACSKQDLMIAFPEIAGHKFCQCWIFAGLTPFECRVLAWGHNIDNEFRSEMSAIQRITYIHHRHVESESRKDVDFRKQVAYEINLKGIGDGKDSVVLNNFDNYFQLAFRPDSVWKFVRRIFDMWEARECKGQKVKKEKKSSVGSMSSNFSGPPEIKMTDWRSMQGIKEEPLISSILQKVIDGALSLTEMSAEFERHKTMAKIETAFKKSLHLDSWLECKATYPEHCKDDTLWGFQKIFNDWGSKGRGRPTKGKKKKGETEEESGANVYPEVFVNYIGQARTWLGMKKTAAVTGTTETACLTSKFEHPTMGDVFYQCFSGDVAKLHEVVAKRDYTLAIADIPYGFDLEDCLHDDKCAWGEEEIRAMVRSWKVITSAPMWRFIIMHSTAQREIVVKILAEECNNVAPQECIWYKPFAKNAGGSRLNSNFECFTIGFFNKYGGRDAAHFNFDRAESRNNVVEANQVGSKVKHVGDGKVVNLYQKPRKLLDWMVKHFSLRRDWVADLCSGSGTGICSALALGRNCVAVELDTRQTSNLFSRIIRLGSDINGESEVPGGMDVPAPVENLLQVVVADSAFSTHGVHGADGAGTSGLGGLMLEPLNLISPTHFPDILPTGTASGWDSGLQLGGEMNALGGGSGGEVGAPKSSETSSAEKRDEAPGNSQGQASGDLGSSIVTVTQGAPSL